MKKLESLCGCREKERKSLSLRVKAGKYKSNKIAKKENGITIIVLIVIIIVLLILAGVIINMAVNKQGIFNKAKIATKSYISAEEKEKIGLLINEYTMENVEKGTSWEDFLKDKKAAKTIDDYNINSDGTSEITIGGTTVKLNQDLKITDDTSDETKIGTVAEFNYNGNNQEYEAKDTGYYYIECLGASGGYSRTQGKTSAKGGNGGYTSGIIKLDKNEKIYIYVGGHGADAIVGKDSIGGYNGGGLGTWDNNDDEAAGAGGGATDIRLVKGECDNFESLKSRIMVAAGGGGASNRTEGGAGGGLIGLTNRDKSIPGNQTSGYKFGIGQNGTGVGKSNGVAGSGGGYYGGLSSEYADNMEAGSGGSSFISGFDGCNAISKDATINNIIHTNQSIHYSGRKFTDSKILDGNSNKIPYNNSNYNGNGYAKITYLGKEIPNVNLKKTEFDYIGDYKEYEAKDTGYYYIECLGASGGYSRAQGETSAKGGNGGYTSGIIKLDKNEKIYIYVGGHGADAIVGKDSIGGYNGGGLGTWDNNDDEAAGAGGGATDIRLVKGECDNFESLKSRIMVAAGGGGASYRTEGGAGGGLIGLTNRDKSIPGNQTSGYKFGIGQNGTGVGDSNGVAGSGGGYYGGLSSEYADNMEAGSGGSSFISGFDGCNAISKDSTINNIIHTNQSIHYSGKKFTDSQLLDGNSNKIPYNNNNYNGNGHATITFLSNNYNEFLIKLLINKINN